MRFKFIFIYFLIVTNSYSQNTAGFEIPNYAPKSPEAAAFLKYGTIPVDLSSGVPNISIPLHTITSKDYRLPISLDYHASGIKVIQEATWVGLGWNLNFGAQIILNAKDGIDENNTYLDVMPTAADINFYNSNPYAFNSGPIYTLHLDESRVKDTYSFFSPTCSGQFYIRNFAQNDIVVYPPDAFKVEKTGERKTLKFIVTDKAGNKYIFNTSEKSVREFTHNDDYLSAWYVDEIKTPVGGSIYFNYINDGDVVEYNSSQSQEVKDECLACGCQFETHVRNAGSLKTEGGDVETSSKKIKEIIFDNNKSRILFTKISGREDLINGNSKLDKIEVQRYNNTTLQFETVKGYQLTYTYFNSAGTVNTKRLKLDRVTNIFDATDFHRFVYSSMTLPAKTSYSQDFFGYYNGKSNLDMIPKHYIGSPYFVTVGSADRNVSGYYSGAAILTELHYPTKGFTKFSYEPNVYFGENQYSQYVLKTVVCAEQGTGAGENNPTEGPSPVDEFYTQCPVDCIQYEVVNIMGTPSNANLLINVSNNVQDNDTEIKYQYVRVRVYKNNYGIIYDSGKRNNNQSFNVQLYDLNGPGFMVVEAWGEHMNGLATLTYTDASTVSENLAGPGLRIKTVENFSDATTKVSRKEYSYNDIIDSTKSSGVIHNMAALSFL